MLAPLTLALVAAGAPEGVFLSPAEAISLVEAGATVIDARGDGADAPYLPRAHVVDWMDLRAELGRSGRLAPDADLRAAFEKVGVRTDHPVLVYGAAADGWGEEGRIWWTLRYLGHQPAYILDGGMKAWSRHGGPTEDAPAKSARRGAIDGEPKRRLRASTREVDEARGRGDVVLLDARAQEEYRGRTPYFSPRGGHVPGAIHLEWRALLRADGTLRPEAELTERLKALGVVPDKRIISYCTGGVRSGFVVAVLTHLGYPDPANYDGSWWAWSLQDDLPVSRP